ncbi:MAG: 4'-phosphopantetheinyl transferase family protein, partial [Segetibacter sp.]
EYMHLLESLLGSAEVEQAYRYRRWQDKQAYLLGKFLLAKLLEKHGYSRKLLKEIRYSEYKRPYLAEVEVDFNVSHSGDFVICAFSTDQKIGVDIELFQKIDLSIYNYILNNDDRKSVEMSKDKYSTFFDIWSAKEAILKAHGCGLVNDLDKLEVNNETGFFENTIYHLKKLEIHPSYSSIVASSIPVKNLEIKEVFINDSSDILETVD